MSKYTKRAEDALHGADKIRESVGCGLVSSEMLLIALSEEFEGMAAQILMNLGVKSEDVLREVNNFTGLRVPEVGDR